MITTASSIAGYRVVKTFGLVRGNTIRARNLGRDLLAVLKNMIGGEITDYTEMMASAREEAIQRMVEDAKKQGANAIVGMRLATSMIMQNASEVLAYGTAVVLE